MPETSTEYVLLTAARNEAAYIEGTLRAVLAQSRKPRRWVIVSDGSTDETDQIVRNYASQADFIVFARRDDGSGGVDFARKVQALRHGYEMLEGLPYDFIGNLDADVTFEADYFETLLGEFHKNPKLGIAGGMIFEPLNGRFMPRYLSEPQYVPGAVQLFRRACFDQVGGYALSRCGGEDTIAVVTARMKGWETRSVPGLQVFHHKVADAIPGAVAGALPGGRDVPCPGQPSPVRASEEHPLDGAGALCPAGRRPAVRVYLGCMQRPAAARLGGIHPISEKRTMGAGKGTVSHSV